MSLMKFIASVNSYTKLKINMPMDQGEVDRVHRDLDHAMTSSNYYLPGNRQKKAVCVANGEVFKLMQLELNEYSVANNLIPGGDTGFNRELSC